MQSVSQTGSRSRIRRIACISAAILLFAQAAAIAHLHPLPSQRQYVTSAAAVVDSGLCALCLVRFHSPAVFVVAPNPTAPALAELIAPSATSTQPRLSHRSHLFGRAPPASV